MKFVIEGVRIPLTKKNIGNDFQETLMSLGISNHSCEPQNIKITPIVGICQGFVTKPCYND